jgi:hypothetical protein
MNSGLCRRLARALLLYPLVALPLGCAVTADGTSSLGVASFGVDYYEPLGYDYGGWGPGYAVGPFRGGGERVGRRGGPPSGHPFRSAGPGRSMPSIPTGPRPGGGGAPGAGRRK